MFWLIGWLAAVLSGKHIQDGISISWFCRKQIDLSVHDFGVTPKQDSSHISFPGTEPLDSLGSNQMMLRHRHMMCSSIWGEIFLDTNITSPPRNIITPMVSGTVNYLLLPYHTIPYHIPYNTIPYHTIASGAVTYLWSTLNIQTLPLFATTKPPSMVVCRVGSRRNRTWLQLSSCYSATQWAVGLAAAGVSQDLFGCFQNWVVLSNIFYFHPENWGNDPFWRSYSWNGLKPPTKKIMVPQNGWFYNGKPF